MARPLRRPPAQTARSAQEGIPRILLARGLRAFGDGLVAILLPVHLARLGYGAAGIGLIATSTLLGSALLTLALGFSAHRLHLRRGLLVAGVLMAGTGLGFAYLQAFWPLLVVAFVGTLNPSGGDVSVFLPLEHALIANLASDQTRTAVYARYSFIGSIGAAVGSLAVGALHGLTEFCLLGMASALCFCSTARLDWPPCFSTRVCRSCARRARNRWLGSVPRAGVFTRSPPCSRLTLSGAASS